MSTAPQPAFRPPTYPWIIILCLVGLDYFSGLAYLPSIAIEQVGPLAPLAGVAVVLVTLFAALPIYWYVIARSPHGKGGLGLLEQRWRGWGGKLTILILLGFVGTDFVLTRSLSVSDAATHVTGNPVYKDNGTWVTKSRDAVLSVLPEYWREPLTDYWTEQLLLTVLLTVLSFALYFFLVQTLSRGFIGFAVGVVALYLVLTGVILASGILYLMKNPEVFRMWERELRPTLGNIRTESGNFVFMALIIGLQAFPAVALGLSGFELSMASAPMVRGGDTDTDAQPAGRIWNTRKLMVAAALIMSLYVLASFFVVPLLVPHDQFKEGALARHRALSYIAHGEAIVGGKDGSDISPLFGTIFGTFYDISSILILCLAGASATISLKELVPEFLARFGMQMEWAHRFHVIIHLFNGLILMVTVAFQASVSAQQWAYAASVLALLFGASLAALKDRQAELRDAFLRGLRLVPWYFVVVLFGAMIALTVVQQFSGVSIALGFVAVVLITAIVSRWKRSTELRFAGFVFLGQSEQRFTELTHGKDFQVLVPHDPSSNTLPRAEEEIRARHRLGPGVKITFIEVYLGDTSDFLQKPTLEMVKEESREVIRVRRCTSISHVIAAIALEFCKEGHPPELHFGWSNDPPMAANLNFLLLGQGNVPFMVRELIRGVMKEGQRQPRIIVG